VIETDRISYQKGFEDAAELFIDILDSANNLKDAKIKAIEALKIIKEKKIQDLRRELFLDI